MTDVNNASASASVDVGSHLTFLDDGPSISAPGASATLTVDETVLATNSTASFAGAFTSTFGADGAGTITYALDVVAGPSGLVDTATGQTVICRWSAAVSKAARRLGNDLVFTG